MDVMNELLILFIEILSFVFLALAESEIEGKYGGGGKKPRFFRFGSIRVRRYHLYMNYLTIPTLLLLPLIAVGFSWRLFGIIVTGALVGGVLQDFFWFIFNPHYGIKKFNRKDAYWIVWKKIGSIDLPYFYYTHPTIAAIVWLLFVA